LLFWALVAVGLHFFPRTMLTAGSFVKGIEGYGQTTFWILLQYSMALIAAGGATILLIATGIDIASSLRAERDTDILTGLLNRRGFESRADEVAMDRRKPRAVIILDLDHFKWINDRFGHAEGDRVLREVGVILRASCRDDDVAVRLGGEEFAILVDGTSVTAAALAERVRQKIEQHHFASRTLDHNVTASFGVAEHKPGESIWDSVKRADTQLYKAKRAGRNVVRSDFGDLEGVEVGEV
jgi:diguanylate cyclase (GGDEF)-like protein